MALVGDHTQSQKGGILRKKQKDEHSSEFMGLVSLKGGKTQTSLHELAKGGSLEELKHSLKIENTQALKVLNNKGSTLLHAAAGTNQMAVMQYLVDHGLDMNAVDHEGNTALHVAVQNGCIDAVHLLLNSGASDSVLNSAHDPPLHIAVRSANLALVLAFLEHPVNILVRGIRNCTVLHIIAELDNVELFKAVHDSSHFEKLLRDLKGFFVKVVDNDNMTPVHVAARKGSHRVLELMISSMELEIGFLKNFVFNALDKENSTPVQHAIESGNILVVEVLLRHGAPLTQTKGNVLPPLHLACRQDRYDMVQLMVEQRGPEILQIRDGQGRTALHHSCTGVCGEGLVSYLFEQGAELDAQDNNGNTALHTTIISGNVSAAEELLKRGSNPSIQDSNGQNCLHHAVLHNRQEILSFLLEHNNCPHLVSTPDNKGNYAIHCALNLRLYDLVILIHESLLLHHFDDHVFLDCDKNNYLHLAAGAGDFRTLSSLLEFKCCFRPMLNAINKTGTTPLHSAASGGNVACVNALVNKGAVVHRCHFGRTPLMYACHVGNLQAAKALYSAHPFQRDWVDNDSNTPLHLAIESGNSTMIQFCLDIGVPITLNSQGKSFFDKILDNIATELALVALDHARWEESFDTSSYITHPMLRLIETMPEAVQVVLNKCHIKSGLDPRHPDYWEEFNFKYVMLSDPEPTAVEWQLSGDSQLAIPTENEEETTHDSPSSIEVEDTPLNPIMMPSPLPKNGAPLGKKEKKSSMEVLQWMIKYKRTPFLVHPVVKAFLKTRWEDYGRWVFLVKFLLVALHTIFLSIFIGITPPPAQVGIGSGNGSTEVGQNNIGTASNVIRFITLFICLVHTVISIVDLYYLRLKVVHLDKNHFTWIHVATIICTYVFLIPGGGLDFVIWEAGALAVFFAWLNLAIFLQLFSILGLYVAMFLQITQNIFKVLLVLCLFLIFAFGFALYILLGTVDGLSFANPGASFYTTFISLLVANDYEQFVGLGNAGSLRFQFFVFVFLVILAIIMPIVFINLLIGLAVGDIEQIKQEAILHNTENRVTALAYIDRLFPAKLLKHCERAKLKRYPNAPISWMAVAWHFFWANLKTETATDDDEIQEKTSPQDPQDPQDRKFEQLQQQIDKIAADQAKQLEAVRQLQDTLTKFLEAQESPRLAAE